MSIQTTRSLKLTNRIFSKLRLSQFVDFYLEKRQNYLRDMSATRAPVYYHQYRLATHPYIKERMYGSCAPVEWCNYKDAKIAHYLQYPLKTKIPYVIEPNDQILTLAGYFGAKSPREALAKIDDIKELIATKNFRGLLVGNDGLVDQFKYYFGDDLSHKLIIYPHMRCLPQASMSDIDAKKNKQNVTFLFLASDYKNKSVDVLLNAWRNVQDLKASRLILACPNIPKDTLRQLKGVDSIEVIAEGPLSVKTKRSLLLQSDISICLTHIDGGANVFEGLQYGHAVITSQFHRSQYLISNNNGFEIQYPNYYYKLGEYGIRYDGINEFLKIVEADMTRGRYDDAVSQLTKVIQKYIDCSDLRLQHSRASLELAWRESVWASNKKLTEIYLQNISP
jgi:hypothetical protein